MSPFAGIWKLKREDLRSQRNQLVKELEKNPEDLRIGVRIKAIDNKIAECTEYIAREKLLEKPAL